LQAQLEGTENRIAVARQKFNASVQDFNASIRKFPRVIYASSFGFEKRAYFEAEETAKEAPKVEF
jgi:LemA protein